jgi:hypothetical protein
MAIEAEATPKGYRSATTGVVSTTEYVAALCVAARKAACKDRRL